MTFKEKDFQIKYNKWCKHIYKKTAAHELKITKSGIWNFSLIKPHQIHNLYVVRNGSFTYKIPDVGISQKPFDSITFYKEPAWVVIMFHASTKQKTFYMIDINCLINEINNSGNKSLTEDRANQIGYKCTLK